MKKLIIGLTLLTSAFTYADVAYVNCSTGKDYSVFKGYMKIENVELHKEGAGFNITGHALSLVDYGLQFKSQASRGYFKEKYKYDCRNIAVYNKQVESIRNLRCIAGEYIRVNEEQVLNIDNKCSIVDFSFDESEIPSDRTRLEMLNDFIYGL